jgi:toluene monooxygenase system protein E
VCSSDLVTRIGEWIAKWEPLADAAISAYCAALPDSPDAAAAALTATREARRALGV